MRVRCTRLLAGLGKPELHSGWLTVGREYTVLELSMIPAEGTGRSAVELRVEADDASIPALFDSASFEVIDGRLPPNWRALISADGRIGFSPGAWQRQGFWEDFFDQTAEALATYRFERDVMRMDD